MKFFVPLIALIILNIYSQDLPIEIKDLDKDLVDALIKQEKLQQGKPEVSDRAELDDLSLDGGVGDNLKGSADIFGFDYIKSIPQSISSTSDLPVPNDFVLSLGDELRIMLTGGKSDSFTLTVGMDGSILIPELGTLNVFGESFSSVKEKIQSLVEVSYVGTKVSVSLQELKAKKINIVGAVKSPGVYIVNPFSTISSSLAYAGGFNDFASLRNITLIRGNDKFFFDLYDLLIYGDRRSDLNIQQGDTLLVNSTNNFVEIKGKVNRPFIYEYKTEERISDLIYYAMGFQRNANQENIAITHLNRIGKLSEVSQLNFSDKDLIAEFGKLIKLEVFSKEYSSTFQTKVLGPLTNQGYFDTPVSKKLYDLITELNFNDDVNPFIGVVQQGKKSNLFSLKDKSTQNIDLTNNAEVFFFNKNNDDLSKRITEFSENYLNIKEMDDTTSEENPESDNYKNLIEEGKDWSKPEDLLSFNSLMLIFDYQLDINYENRSIKFPFFGEAAVSEIVEYLGLDLSGINKERTTFIAPIDEISLRGDLEELIIRSAKFNYLNLRDLSYQILEVNINGEVNLPGKYIMMPGASLADLYDLANGYTAVADENAVIFTRASIREKNIEAIKLAQSKLRESLIVNSSDLSDSSVAALLNEEIDEESLGRISGNLNLNSPDLDKFLLESGDNIFVPKKLFTVSVIGEVLNPSTFIYNDDMTLRSVISKSGGYTQNASKRSVYVIRSNGEVVASPGIFHKNIQIKKGDTVVIPTNFNANENIITTLAPITSILSNLAFSAAAIDNLRQ